MIRFGRTPFALLGLATALLAGGTREVAAQGGAVIRGRVASDQGQPLAGATVLLPQLNITTNTNNAGGYVITVPAARVSGQAAQVVARAIGFKPSTQQITVGAGEQTINFTLATDVNRLEEIVTTGVAAGTEQAKLPFTVGKVTAEDLPVPAANPLSALQGKIPGATIIGASGRPGAQPAVILRGPTSLNAAGRGQDPLYIVDGVVLTGGLPDLNALDIESIEVVKGAAAASLYGARAGNGVIQITTKTGKTQAQDGIRFNVRTEYGRSDVERRFQLSNATALFKDETGNGFCAQATQSGNAPLCGVTLDWNRELLRINQAGGDFAVSPQTFALDVGPGLNLTGNGQNAQIFQNQQWPGTTFNQINRFLDPQPFSQSNIDMTGRFGQTNFFASVSYLDQGGAIRFLNGQERYSGRINIDQKIGNTINVGLRTFYSRNSADGFNQEDNGTAFFRLTRQRPISDLLGTDNLGRPFIRTDLQGSGNQNENPLSDTRFNRRVDNFTRFLAGITARWTPVNWFELSGNFSYDDGSWGFSQFRDRGFRTPGPAANPGLNFGTILRGDGTQRSLNGGLDAIFRYDLAKDLRTRTTFRYFYEQQDFLFQNGSGNTLAVSGIDALGNATAGQTIGSSRGSARGIGLFANVNLDYKDRYIVDALIRRDGSSLFGANNRWATFGRVSLAYRLSEEPFWKGMKGFINDLKFRASYGTAGGRPNLFAQYETFSVAGGLIQPAAGGNSLLRPEVTREWEWGLDAELFNRVGVTVTYATSRTNNQLLQVPLPSAGGFGSQWQNAGEILNRTLELAVNIPVINSKDVGWTSRFIFDRNRTYITRLDVPPFNFGPGGVVQNGGDIFRAQVGERFGAFYGRQFLTSCSMLPASFQGQCTDDPNAGQSSTTQFQRNDDGWIVWTGFNNTWQQGVTDNLWRTSLPAAQAPYGLPVAYGLPIIQRDAGGNGTVGLLGQALPDYRFGITQELRFKRLSIYGLLDATIGRSIWNQGYTWALFDFMSGTQDQVGKSVETAKPVSYYYRANRDNAAGLGGLYDILGPNNNNVQSGSFARLRELSVNYRVGQIGGFGNWNVSIVGRNLFTITNYIGFDPEVGIGPNTPNPLVGNGGGNAASAAINVVDAFTFPNVRTLTFAISTTF